MHAAWTSYRPCPVPAQARRTTRRVAGDGNREIGRKLAAKPDSRFPEESMESADSLCGRPCNDRRSGFFAASPSTQLRVPPGLSYTGGPDGRDAAVLRNRSLPGRSGVEGQDVANGDSRPRWPGRNNAPALEAIEIAAPWPAKIQRGARHRRSGSRSCPTPLSRGTAPPGGRPDSSPWASWKATASRPPRNTALRPSQTGSCPTKVRFRYRTALRTAWGLAAPSASKPSTTAR